jgi:hypothetical protein
MNIWYDDANIDLSCKLFRFWYMHASLLTLWPIFRVSNVDFLLGFMTKLTHQIYKIFFSSSNVCISTSLPAIVVCTCRPDTCHKQQPYLTFSNDLRLFFSFFCWKWHVQNLCTDCRTYYILAVKFRKELTAVYKLGARELGLLRSLTCYNFTSRSSKFQTLLHIIYIFFNFREECFSLFLNMSLYPTRHICNFLNWELSPQTTQSENRSFGDLNSESWGAT